MEKLLKGGLPFNQLYQRLFVDYANSPSVNLLNYTGFNNIAYHLREGRALHSEKLRQLFDGKFQFYLGGIFFKKIKGQFFNYRIKIKECDLFGQKREPVGYVVEVSQRDD